MHILFQTDRLEFRPLQISDWQFLQEIGGSQEVACMLSSVPSPWKENDVKAWIVKSEFKNEVGFRLGICLHGGRLIGMIGLGGEYQPSVSYFVSQQFWGRGFATEALNGLLDYAFLTYNLDIVTSDVFFDNVSSQHVLKKSGFKKYGQEMGISQARLEPAVVFLYRLSKVQFESRIL